jgi:hypothetical protein
VSCEDEDAKSQEAILGKWELIEQGRDEDNMKAVTSTGGYIEFLSNGNMHHYDPVTQEYSGEQMYKIDSKFLYYNYEKGIDERFVNKHHFYEDKLKLTYVSGGNIPDIYGIPCIFIYKRIK